MAITNGNVTTNTGAGSSTAVANIPTGVANTHVILCGVGVSGGSGTSITPPGGWTSILRTNSTTVYGVELFYRVSPGGEPASYNFTLGASVNWGTFLINYIGVDNLNPINASGGQANASSTSVTAPSITTTAANCMLVGFFGVVAAVTFTPPSGMTERQDNSSEEIADVLRAVAGSTGTKVATASGAGLNIGQLVALRPAVSDLPFRSGRRVAQLVGRF